MKNLPSAPKTFLDKLMSYNEVGEHNQSWNNNNGSIRIGMFFKTEADDIIKSLRQNKVFAYWSCLACSFQTSASWKVSFWKIDKCWKLAMFQGLVRKKVAVCAELCFAIWIKYVFVITVQLSSKVKFACTTLIEFFINMVKYSATKVFLKRSMMHLTHYLISVFS